MSKKYTVTSALPYANGPLHIGHCRSIFAADIYVVIENQKGMMCCLFVGRMSTECYNLEQKGQCSPQEIVDKYHAINEKAFRPWNRV